MLQVAAGRHVAAALSAAALFLTPDSALAQDEDPFAELEQPVDVEVDPEVPLEDVPLGDIPPDPDAPLDPSAPLDPMPDIGVDWPDLAEDADEAIAEAPDTGVADAATERTYSVVIRGLDEGVEAGLRPQFDQLSTLQLNRRDPEIGRAHV